MDLSRPKIKIYQVRTFSEKLSATIDFVRENWKALFVHITYLLLPLCLLQAFAMNTFFDGYFQLIFGGMKGVADNMAMPVSFGVSLLANLVAYTVGSLLLMSVVYALMQLYVKREERLVGITAADVKPLLFKNMKKSVAIFLVSLLVMVGFLIVLVLPIAMLSMVSLPSVLIGSIVVVVYLLLLIALVPFALVMPICMFEEINVFRAIAKAYRLGFRTWGGIFGMLFVLSLIASIVQMVVVLPWEVALGIQSYFGLSGEESAFVSSAAYSFIVYLLGVLMLFVSYMVAALPVVGIAVQYGHAADKIDHVAVMENIEHFDQL
jgi:hypothetical protein